jgi:lipopolysaccharide export system permease protein
MNQLQRQTVTETFHIFCLASLVALVLITLGTGAQEGVRRGLPPSLVLQTLPFLGAETLRLVIPGCLLFSICSLFGNMSAANEILALKALGIHPLRIIWPVLALALALSLFTTWLYEACAVWGRPQMKRVIAESLDDIAYSMLKQNKTFHTPEFSIVVSDVIENRLMDPIVTIHGQPGSPSATLTAEHAELRTNPRAGTLWFTCRNGLLEIDGIGKLSFAERLNHQIRLPGLEPKSPDVLPPAELPADLIPQQIQSIQHQLAALLAGHRASPETAQVEAASEGRIATANSQAIPTQAKPTQETQLQIKQLRERLWRLQAERSRRLSNGFACFCFALIGAPVAIAMRTADTVSVFFACFLPILLGYYPLLVVGENLARGGISPALSVWLANIALGVAGAFVLSWVVRR